MNCIVTEHKIHDRKLCCLLTGDATAYTNDDVTGIYEWDKDNISWSLKRTTVVHPLNIVESRFEFWAYPTGFDVDDESARTMCLIDMEKNWNYLASGFWKSTDDGMIWKRVQQFTFPSNFMCVAGDGNSND